MNRANCCEFLTWKSEGKELWQCIRVWGDKGYNGVERNIRLMDLGQSIETWDSSCWATNVVVGLGGGLLAAVSAKHCSSCSLRRWLGPLPWASRCLGLLAYPTFWHCSHCCPSYVCSFIMVRTLGVSRKHLPLPGTQRALLLVAFDCQYCLSGDHMHVLLLP